ncbi:hypothetical protein MTR67_043883 [Solanum verrucosum]|uniref:Tf2-1-like SH3-like domain-containing protein n=1 Tax=Solanum verrucosum TaxID=315347 RepID=A0AAF0UPJ6_SOLVR|nr:hypothetical protein MTR67_043883 [Solanum verrucosum]
MPLSRVVRGHPSRRNVDPQDQGVPNAPEVQPQGQVTIVEFRDAIRMLSQVVTNQVGQQRRNQHDVCHDPRLPPRHDTGLGMARTNQKCKSRKRSREMDRSATTRTRVGGVLSVSPIKGVMRFGKKGKLSPRYIGPYRISKRISNIAYKLELPPELAAVHPVFPISILKNSMGDPSLIIPTKDIGIMDNLSYEEIPFEILDC